MPTFHIADERIAIETAIFTVTLDRRPPRLSIQRNGETVWQSGPAFGHARDREAWLIPHMLEEVRLTGEGLRLTALTADLSRSLLLVLAVDEDGVSVHWQADHILDEWREEAYLASAGHWYGQGGLARGVYPLEDEPLYADPFITASAHPHGLLGIQSPVWITSKGVGVILENERDLAIRLSNGLWSVTARRQTHLTYRITIGRNLADVHRRHARRMGCPSDRPIFELMRTPQWTTGARFPIGIDQDTLLHFAREILEHGFSAGLFGIDGRWQAHEGDVDFDRERFPKPHELIAELQDLGFLVTLQVTPLVSPASRHFREGRQRGYFIRRLKDGQPYLMRGRGGEGSLVDFDNPEAAAWWLDKLQALRDRYGVDGFEFDSGDGNWAPADGLTASGFNPNSYSDAYVAWVARHFRWCEVRFGWRSQGAPLLFRLADKGSHWGAENGLQAIIPQVLHVGLAGYPFVTAGVIGGEQGGDQRTEKELFIRWTELSAALPAMRFSLAPWDFDLETEEICRRYTHLHQELIPALDRATRQAVVIGAPVIRPLSWLWDDEAAHRCADQFLLGDECCVAPVVVPGARSRDVLLPPGKWRDHWTSECLDGPTALRNHSAPLDRLPLFHREG
ncbi:MAG: glycoside hydrolase family 31 protein [Anaerolineae bacterium]|nr:glycoside hydrolase family 31 protein [Anaerolineae bacterium]MDW8098939.1 glycoside hydrolase family 31 protein [Anaerolineae bacterium]